MRLIAKAKCFATFCAVACLTACGGSSTYHPTQNAPTIRSSSSKSRPLSLSVPAPAAGSVDLTRPARDSAPHYVVGVDYHAYGADFIHTAFITIYNDPTIRQTVLTQLQGIADSGATVISTRIWLVNEPGGPNFGEMWRATFPLTDQEQANLHQYAQDVASIQGANGNRLRLDICLLWLGAADYTRGTLAAGLGWTPLTPAVFTSRVNTTIDKTLAAISAVTRPDGLPVVDTVYMEGEVMIGAKANQDWFLTTHYPAFVSKVKSAGFIPAVYFITAGTQADILQFPYTDVDYPILNNHRSQFWNYRSMKFMVDNGLPLPPRIDFSFYISDPAGADFPALLKRTLDDADATLPSLGAPKLYRAAETSYFLDAVLRHALGQAFADEAKSNSRLEGVCFWTTPDAGGAGVNIGYPFFIADYLELPDPVSPVIVPVRPSRP
jgi:hypothetical protein